MDDELAQTIRDFRKDVREDFREVKDRLGKHGEQLAVQSQRMEGVESRLVKVETKSMPPKPPSSISNRQIAALVVAVLTAIGGGSWKVVDSTLEAQAKDDAAERSQREAMANLARALAEANKAQASGAEAMVALDPTAAQAAKRAAQQAIAEAMKAEKSIRQNEELQP